MIWSHLISLEEDCGLPLLQLSPVTGDQEGGISWLSIALFVVESKWLRWPELLLMDRPKMGYCSGPGAHLGTAWFEELGQSGDRICCWYWID